MGGNIQVPRRGLWRTIRGAPLLPLESAQSDAIVADAMASPQMLAATRRVVTGGMVSGREGSFAVATRGSSPRRNAASLIGQRVTWAAT